MPESSKSSKPSDTPALKTLGDPRVAKALDELGMNHQLDADGDFRLIFSMPEERSQICVVTSRTEEFIGVEWRRVFAPALRSFGPFDARTANLLLRETGDLKMGSWVVRADPEDNHLAFFELRVPADASPQALLEAIECATLVADHMEFRLSGRDEF